MKKNGFTLIELLAVLIILGIISLIIVPKINGVIVSSRKKSNEVSVNNLVSTLNSMAIDKKANLIFFGGCSINFDSGENSCSDLDYSGTLPDSGYISVDGEGNVNGSVGYGNDIFYINNGKVQYSID